MLVSAAKWIRVWDVDVVVGVGKLGPRLSQSVGCKLLKARPIKIREKEREKSVFFFASNPRVVRNRARNKKVFPP